MKYAVEDEDEYQTCFENRKQKTTKFTLNIFHLVDFIRLDPAEIRRLLGKTQLAVSA
jgi:hypothetical protein